MSISIKTSQLAPGQITSADLYGVGVAIANVGGAFYAISDVCPFDATPLSQGRVEDNVIICRTDGSRFDLVSGSVLSGPATGRVRTYRVQVYGDELRI
jgi:3-phenylpropionate/trans-cinnamate dioxygenase ferredoxin subunit